MTNSLGIDWAILAISLFNTILLFWLGLMVLLNSERRTWGLYLSGSALLLGGMFFLAHTVIVGSGTATPLQEIDLYWRLGWIPITCLPLAWYAVMLWYGGYWEAESNLHPRHKVWFRSMLVMAVGFILLLIFANPLPSVAQMFALNFSAAPAVFGVPIFIVLYPPYTILCTGLSLDALRQPNPPARAMGEQARERARPWLGAASLALFVISLLVGGTIFWVMMTVRASSYDSTMVFVVGWLDLLMASLIGLSVLLVGQAIVNYEVFTGKVLPQRGLARYWQRAVILAGGYSVLVSAALTLDFSPVYLALTATLLVIAFYSLLSWRAFAERERFVENLRPFLTSQGLLDQLLLGQAEDHPTSFASAFQGLCTHILETRLAYLFPLGSLAQMVGAPLVFPTGKLPEGEWINELASSLIDDRALCLPAAPGLLEGIQWIVPLHHQRGLAGLLLLGGKRQGSLYTQEEVEIARLAGERLLDSMASAELARRLMVLQRQRLMESQVMDRRTRRVLHDEVLPQLHATLLELSSPTVPLDKPSLTAALADLHARIAKLLHDMPGSIAPEISRLGFLGALQRLVTEEFREDFDQVDWLVPAGETGLEKLSPLAAEVLYYATRESVRNAARYGRGTDAKRALKLRIEITHHDGMQISIEDDGVGINPGAVSNGGSQQGLALHSTLLAVLGGSLEVNSLPEKGTRVILNLPTQTMQMLASQNEPVGGLKIG